MVSCAAHHVMWMLPTMYSNMNHILLILIRSTQPLVYLSVCKPTGSLVKSFLTSDLLISHKLTFLVAESTVPDSFWRYHHQYSSIMAATLCQVLGFLLSLLGVAGIIAATGMDQWATQDLFDNPVTAVYTYSGLWRSCVRESSGFTQCRPYFTILGLPGKLCFVTIDTEAAYRKKTQWICKGRTV